MSLLCRMRSVRCPWHANAINQSIYRASIYRTDSQSRRNIHCGVLLLQQSNQNSTLAAVNTNSRVTDVNDVSSPISKVHASSRTTKRKKWRSRNQTKPKQTEPKDSYFKATQELVATIPLFWSSLICPQSVNQLTEQSATAIFEYVGTWFQWFNCVRSMSETIARFPLQIRMNFGNVLVSVLRIPSQHIVDQESVNTKSNSNNQPIIVPSEQQIFDLLVDWRLATDSTTHDLIIRQCLFCTTDLSIACQRLDSLYEMNRGRAQNSIQVEIDLINCMLLKQLLKHNHRSEAASIEQANDPASVRLSAMAVRVFDKNVSKLPSIPYTWIIALVQCCMHDIQSIHHLISGLSSLKMSSGHKQLYKAVAPILNGLRNQLTAQQHWTSQLVQSSIESDLACLDQTTEKLRIFCQLSHKHSQLFHLPTDPVNVQTIFTYDHPSVRLIKSTLSRQTSDPTDVDTDISQAKSVHPEIVHAVALLQLYRDVAPRESWYAVIDACQSKKAFNYLNDVWNAWQSTFPVTSSGLSVDPSQNSSSVRFVTLTEDQLSRLPNAALFTQLLKLPNPPLTAHQAVSLLDQWGLPTNVRLHIEIIQTCISSHVRHANPKSLLEAVFWYEDMFRRGLIAGSQIVRSEFRLIDELLIYESSRYHRYSPDIIRDPIATAHDIAVKAWNHITLQLLPTNWYNAFINAFGKYMERSITQSLSESQINDLLNDSERCIALWQSAQSRIETESIKHPNFKQQVFSLGLQAVRWRLMVLEKVSQSHVSHDLDQFQLEIQKLREYLDKYS